MKYFIRNIWYVNNNKLSYYAEEILFRMSKPDCNCTDPSISVTESKKLLVGVVKKLSNLVCIVCNCVHCM